MNIQQPVAIPTSTLLVDDLSNLVKTLARIALKYDLYFKVLTH